MIGEFLMFLGYIPGSAELLCTLIVLLILLLRKTGTKLESLNRSVLISSIIGFVIWATILIVSDTSPFLKPVQYVLIGAWAYLVLKSGKPTLLKLSFPVTAIIFAVFTWQFTFARQDFKAEVVCHGVKTPVVASLSYHYGELAGYHFKEVNGKEWSLGDEWPECSPPESMPQYSFGIRGLTFSHM